MKFKKLGRTDIDVSLICLGTMTWGLQNNEADGHQQMDYAIDQGINFFDTAEIYAVPPSAETYGKTEKIIGTWFADRKNRDQIILASKIGGVGPAWIRDGKNKIDRQNILMALEDSLKRLQTDYIDLYQLHWPNRPSYHFANFWNEPSADVDTAAEQDNFLEVLETLDELIKAGKIRYAGLSNETAWGTMEYLRIAEENGLPRMVSIQNEYSLLKRIFEPDLAEIALREDIGLLAWSPLAGGMISGKYLGGARPEGTRWALGGKYNYRDTDTANKALVVYHEIAKKYGKDPVQMALAFVNQQNFVTSNIIGATSMEQLETNIDSINVILSDECLADIKKVRMQYPIPF